MTSNPKTATTSPIKKAVDELSDTSPGGVKTALESYVKEHPLEAVIQAAAAGYALRFLSIRSLLTVAAKLAVPGLFIAGAWKACEHLEPKAQK